MSDGVYFASMERRADTVDDSGSASVFRDLAYELNRANSSAEAFAAVCTALVSTATLDSAGVYLPEPGGLRLVTRQGAGSHPGTFLPRGTVSCDLPMEGKPSFPSASSSDEPTFVIWPVIFKGDVIGALFAHSAGLSTKTLSCVESAAAVCTRAFNDLLRPAAGTGASEDARKLLEQSRERLEMAILGGNLGTWDWNIPDGRVVFNARWGEMLGYSPDELEQNVATWEKLLNPEDRDAVVDALKEHLDGKTPLYQTMHRVRTKDGSWRWVLDTGKVVERAPDGRPLRAAGTHLDMTERTEAGLKLEFREQFEKIIMTLSTDFINLESDEIDRGITRALKAIGEFLKADRSYVFLFSDNGEIMSNTHEWCAEGISPQIGMLQNLPSDSLPWWVDRMRGWETILIRDIEELPPEAAAEKEILKAQDIKSLVAVPILHGDELIGFAGFDAVRDYRGWDRDGMNLLRTVGELIANVLKRARYEREIRSAREEAQRASRAKSEFLANMSHEIRTPMNAVIGISKLLQGRHSDNLSGKQREGLSLIHESGMRLMGIIDDILDLSRIETGQVRVNITRFSLRTFVAEMEALAKTLSEGKDLEIDFRLEAGDDTVSADHEKVRQMLTNLVDNAVKYTEKGSVKVTIRSDGKMLRCTVADTGIGIPDDYVPHLFEPFSQADLSTTKRFRGSGLGLAICKRYANLLGGSVSVESVLGAGTTVSFDVPLSAAPASGIVILRKEPADAPAEQRRPVVLVIDDDESVRKSLRLMLEDDFDLVLAADGRAGIERANADRPDLVLLDIMMPGMNGFDVFTSIRGNEHTSSIPVIAVTSRAMPYELQMVRSFGFDACITKPLDGEILVTLIRNTLHSPERSLS